MRGLRAGPGTHGLRRAVLAARSATLPETVGGAGLTFTPGTRTFFRSFKLFCPQGIIDLPETHVTRPQRQRMRPGGRGVRVRGAFACRGPRSGERARG